MCTVFGDTCSVAYDSDATVMVGSMVDFILKRNAMLLSTADSAFYVTPTGFYVWKNGSSYG